MAQEHILSGRPDHNIYSMLGYTQPSYLILTMHSHSRDIFSTWNPIFLHLHAVYSTTIWLPLNLPAYAENWGSSRKVHKQTEQAV